MYSSQISPRDSPCDLILCCAFDVGAVVGCYHGDGELMCGDVLGIKHVCTDIHVNDALWYRVHLETYKDETQSA